MKAGKGYSLGCLVLCLGGFVALLSWAELREALPWQVLIGVVVVLFVCFFFSLYELGNKKGDTPTAPAERSGKPKYSTKTAIITDCEKDFLALLTEAVAGRFVIIPQMPLTGVIDKNTQNTYRSELFRTVDFCLADLRTYRPRVLIELNDMSHRRADRAERDAKVAEICRAAGLPLLVFWTDKQHTADSIWRAIKKIL